MKRRGGGNNQTLKFEPAPADGPRGTGPCLPHTKAHLLFYPEHVRGAHPITKTLGSSVVSDLIDTDTMLVVKPLCRPARWLISYCKVIVVIYARY